MWMNETGVAHMADQDRLAALNPRTAALINAALNAPKMHVVISTYADGKTYRHETRCAKTAENWAIGERRNIGRDLISRETGKTVRVVSVEILPLA
jgi:hypothetical protein